SVYDSVRPRCMPHVEPPANQVIDEMELDGKAGFSDVAGNGIDSSGLSHNESFGVDDMDLNVPNDHVVNESDTHVDVEPAVDVGRTEEHVVEQVRVDEVVDGSVEEDVVHGSGEEDVEHGNIDSAYETQYHVESSEDACTNDDDDEDDDFLVDEENEIVEPDVDVHLFGISKDVPFDNIGVTSLVLDDVLEGEDVDVVNPDGFDNDISYDNETSTYRMRS
ncbi:hypothetical protein Tco_0241716, partial [Tanacetum coccineum]